ncbi:zinc finger MYND domain-containing protein 15 [Struthio camelus]|uniref:zinc finger MYND domain-containing protein 15 n=1 Tax=Struthio camelus TaxID=8801 RepID=UPI003603D2B0
MEFVTGYRAEVLDLAELLLGWRRRGGPGGDVGVPPGPGQLRRLPPDPGLWVLHVLPNARLGLALALPGAGGGTARGADPRGPLCGDGALTLRDLRRAVTFVSLEEEEEEEGAGPPPGQALVRLARLLLVTDERGAPLGFDFEVGPPRGAPTATTTPLARRALTLLARAMGCPMAGGPPRRPRLLAVADADLHAALEPLVARLGVKLAPGPLRGWGPRAAFTFPSPRVRACHVCKRHGFQRRLAPCPQCRAVLYCSERCRVADWSGDAEAGGHRGWCQRLGGFMGRAGALAQLPFTFAAEVTSETFDKEGFLAARGLTQGCWAHESMLVRAPDYGVGLGGGRSPLGPQPHGHPFEGLQPAGGVSLPPAPPEPPEPKNYFSSWQQYYAWRGLPLSSPLAVLLSYPLSVYHIVTQLVPQHFPELNILNKQSLKIHVVETGRELQLAGLFWELSVLLPHVALELLFTGDAVPPDMDGRHFLVQRTEVQELGLGQGPPPRARGGRGVQVGFSTHPAPSRPGPRPDLVVGFNPGFALKETWLSALPRLQALRVPAYFTEGGEYGCAVAGAAVAAATGGSASPPRLNPFRSPFRRPGIDNALPWYANAFIFHLLYKGGPRGGAPPAPPPPPAPPRGRRRPQRPPHCYNPLYLPGACYNTYCSPIACYSAP